MSFGNCERCHDPGAITHEYNLQKPNSLRRVNLCDACAQITRDGPYKLTGGKAPEAKPSEPDTEVKEKEPEARSRRK